MENTEKEKKTGNITDSDLHTDTGAFTDPDLHTDTGTFTDPDLHIEPESQKEKHIAAVVLGICALCIVLFVIISVNLISDKLSSAYRSFNAHFSDRIKNELPEKKPDADKKPLFNASDKVPAPEENTPGRDHVLKLDEKNTGASDGTGETIADFCDSDDIDKMLANKNDHRINLTVWYQGAFYSTDDREVVLPVLDAVQTVKIGEPTLESFSSGDSLSFSFYDYEDQNIISYNFFNDIFSWNKDNGPDYYKVADWGDLKDMQFEFSDGKVTLAGSSDAAEQVSTEASGYDIHENSLINTEYSKKLREDMEKGLIPGKLLFEAVTYGDEKITIDDPALIKEIYDRMSLIDIEYEREPDKPDYYLTFYLQDGTEQKYGFDQFYSYAETDTAEYVLKGGEFLRQLMGGVKKGEVGKEFTHPEASGKYYNISIGEDEGGYIKDHPKKARAGEIVFIKTDPEAEFSFSANDDINESLLYDGIYVFSMPAGDVLLYARQYEDILDGPGTPGS